MATKSQKIVSTITIVKPEDPSHPMMIKLTGDWRRVELNALPRLIIKAHKHHLVEQRKVTK